MVGVCLLVAIVCCGFCGDGDDDGANCCGSNLCHFKEKIEETK